MADAAERAARVHADGLSVMTPVMLGDVSRSEPTTRRTFRIPDEVFAEAQAQADELDTTVTSWVVDDLRRRVKRQSRALRKAAPATSEDAGDVLPEG